MRPIVDLWFVTNIVLVSFVVSSMLLTPPMLGLAFLRQLNSSQ
jgi:hypothetical protein